MILEQQVAQCHNNIPTYDNFTEIENRPNVLYGVEFDNNLYLELPSVSEKLFNWWYMYYDYALLTDAMFEWHDMKVTRIIHDDPDHASTANVFYYE